MLSSAFLFASCCLILQPAGQLRGQQREAQQQGAVSLVLPNCSQRQEAGGSRGPAAQQVWMELDCHHWKR